MPDAPSPIDAISARHQSTYDQLEAGHLAARPSHDALEQARADAAAERFAGRARARRDADFLAAKTEARRARRAAESPASSTTPRQRPQRSPR